MFAQMYGVYPFFCLSSTPTLIRIKIEPNAGLRFESDVSYPQKTDRAVHETAPPTVPTQSLCAVVWHALRNEYRLYIYRFMFLHLWNSCGLLEACPILRQTRCTLAEITITPNVGYQKPKCQRSRTLLSSHKG